MKNQIGLIGLAVMGENLARNIASKGYTISVYNRSSDKTESFIQKKYSDNLTGTFSLPEFVASLELPRKIIIMVKAGSPVDDMIEQLRPLIQPGDTIIDCGNTFYRDTERRYSSLARDGIHYIGCGVSGGEEGALKGPSIMPGGDKSAYERVRPILEVIAAEDFHGGKCVSYIGVGGSGHFVKMVHNGIEYSIMQMMAEAYDLLRKVYHLDNPAIAKIFSGYNNGRLHSYLFEIAVRILEKRDEFDKDVFLLDKILDRAGAKGTGLWTSIEGLEQGVSVSCITEATVARMISGEKSLREKLAEKYTLGDTVGEHDSVEETISHLEDALYAGMTLSYAQGLDLIQKTSKKNGWEIDLAEVTRIWQGGCIIRAEILSFLTQALQGDTTSVNILELDAIRISLQKDLLGYQEIIMIATKGIVATPVLSMGLNYLYAITDSHSPANFIQGLRDYFGAHTYERTDMEGIYHTNWQ